jgi:hypothetical protein
MHIISFEYPENPNEYNKRIYHDFYTSLKDVIPCLECQKHYRDFITRYPITPHLDSRSALIKWVIQVHNFVNSSLGKQNLTVEQVLNIYANLKPQSPFIKINTENIIKNTEEKETARIWFFIILALLIIILSRYYFNRYYFCF